MRSSSVAVADEHAADLVRLEQPLVRVEHERVGAIEAGQRGASGVGERRGRAVGAVDVQPDAVLGAQVGERRQRVDRAGRGRAGGGRDAERHAPGGAVCVDRPRAAPPPAAGSRRPPRSPAAARARSRARAARAPPTRAPGRTCRRPPRPARARRSARSAPPPARPGWRPTRRSRARPRCPPASRTSSRSQSSTTSSTVAGPEPPVHDPANTLNPAAAVSASTLAKLLGLPMRAKKRGWSGCCTNGSTCSNRAVSAASGSPGASGGGPPIAARSACASPTRIGGSSPSRSRCSTTWSTTR